VAVAWRRMMGKRLESERQWRESTSGATGSSIARDLASRSSYPLPHCRELDSTKTWTKQSKLSQGFVLDVVSITMLSGASVTVEGILLLD
jgi:hypothetical protein